ncbi:hypothetical protein [Sulfurospirillum barnesii]|uniref:Uncharacterized protein n=1 Tax=Sulfurospirillum barnesii (strain ATCC 700032 / DSM 10660 / SES-3) TaxID=760154 RepID=I3XUP9_SULBS|nr:hypothetical protein [Sulfurospirillum barnesii]AFL67673.1 hypothetical protein Sulba_0349 [Sulfurospirillum barnesii SES-3]
MNHKTHILMYQNNNGTIKVMYGLKMDNIVGDLVWGLFPDGSEVPFDTHDFMTHHFSVIGATQNTNTLIF